MIVETIVSTLSPGGKLNFAPMGARLALDGKTSLVVYHSATTYKNLKRNRSCVINMVSDVRMFVLTTLYNHQPPCQLSSAAAGGIIEGADKALEFIVDEERELEGKTEFFGHVAGSRQINTPPSGFCRAEGAVIEALIAITRKGIIGEKDIGDQLWRSRAIVDKTGGPLEDEAMRLIEERWTLRE